MYAKTTELIAKEDWSDQTISTNAVSVLSRGQNGTTAATHADGATVEFYTRYEINLIIKTY